MPTNSKEYAKKYARMRRFLKRLSDPVRKKPGVKLGYKFGRRIKVER